MAAPVDSNSPAYWRGDEFNLINSTGSSFLTISSDQFQLNFGQIEEVAVDSGEHFPMWIEAVWQDSDGTLYAWYHHEPVGICPHSNLTAPEIGALVSFDGGESFTDLGIVLSSGDAPDCSAQNGFFAGGHGDFSVILDREQRYFYFLFDNYGGSPAGQGVGMARVAFEDRMNPVGAVWKYAGNDWSEPGLGGQLTPIFPVRTAWQQANTDAPWGPSIHWNTYLQSYVVLFNHACCAPGWPQEGIYLSFNPDLSNPTAWTDPQRILTGKDIGFSPGWYPQVLGIGSEETDTVAGRLARLYVKGLSKWQIVFLPK